MSQASNTQPQGQIAKLKNIILFNFSIVFDYVEKSSDILIFVFSAARIGLLSSVF